MNKVIVGVLVGLAIGATATWIILRSSPATDKAAEAEAETSTESFLQTDANGIARIKLDQDAQTRMGLKVAELASAQVQPEVTAFGRVLDPASLADRLAETATAQAALDASVKELDRLKTLVQGQNASARALESADAAARRDRIALEVAQARLLLGWGKAVVLRQDLAGLIHSLVAQDAALIRVDLPLGESLKDPPARGRIASLARPDSPVAVEVLGPAPAVDSQMQGQGFLLLQKSSPLSPGTAVKVWLTVPGQVESGVTVPREAVLRHEAEVFVYLQTGNDTFSRRQIELARPLDTGWFVRSLKPQDKVVIVGSQQLLSEELKGQIGGD